MTCRYEERRVADPLRVLRGVYEFAGSAGPQRFSVDRVSSGFGCAGSHDPSFDRRRESVRRAARAPREDPRRQGAGGEREMRIAQIIDALQVSGGAERLQLLFAETVAHSDVELTIITLRHNDPEMVDALERLGVRVVSFPSRRFLSPARAVALLRFLRRESFDVVHTHLVRSTVLGVLAGRAAAIPTVATLHNTRTKTASTRGAARCRRVRAPVTPPTAWSRLDGRRRASSARGCAAGTSTSFRTAWTKAARSRLRSATRSAAIWA